MRVTIPSPLLSYTGQREVQAEGATVDAVLRDLERQFTGIRFRMVDEQDCLRTHMRLFVGQAELHDLNTPLAPTDTLHIIQALSGG
jgi:molybdopterin converting factor small subunit